jgi:hypothetical protein
VLERNFDVPKEDVGVGGDVDSLVGECIVPQQVDRVIGGRHFIIS